MPAGVCDFTLLNGVKVGHRLSALGRLLPCLRKHDD